MPYSKLAALLLVVSVLIGGALTAQEPQQQREFRYPRLEALPTHDEAGNPIVRHCRIEPVEDINVPAADPGVLVYQGVKQGTRVEAEDVIAKIDAREVATEQRIAQYELNAKTKAALDDIEIRYATAAEGVAREDKESVLAANAGIENAISVPEVNKAKLEHKRAQLAIEKAKKDQELAKLDAWTAKAKVEAADMKIDRRTIRADFDGIVLAVHRDQGEWVNPGDTIARLVRLDTLRVDGMIDLAHHSPAEVIGCEVTVIAEVGRGREVEATGRIVNVKPEAISGRAIEVRAEIANREEDGQWLIFPKMKSRMIVHLGTGGVAVGRK